MPQEYIEVSLDPGYGLADPTLLTSALKAQFGNVVLGVGVHGAATHRARAYLALGTSQAVQDQVSAALGAFDPVFLSVDKTNIQADNIDTATVTVSAPKPGAAAVVLLVNGVALPVTLTNGVGTAQITAIDPTTITVSVQNPASRSADTLTIRST